MTDSVVARPTILKGWDEYAPRARWWNTDYDYVYRRRHPLGDTIYVRVVYVIEADDLDEIQRFRVEGWNVAIDAPREGVRILLWRSPLIEQKSPRIGFVRGN